MPDGNPNDRRIVQGGTPGAINSVLPGPTGVRFNEWMAVNQGAATDPADGDYEDWLELHNALDVPADLTGCFLTDDPADPHQFAIPAGTIIPARGFLLCWADEEGGQAVPGGALHLNFRLSQSGEQLMLVSPNDTVLDTVTFGQQNIDRSEGRWPDGGSDLERLSLPTPGSANASPEDTGRPAAHSWDREEPIGELHRHLVHLRGRPVTASRSEMTSRLEIGRMPPSTSWPRVPPFPPRIRLLPTRNATTGSCD